MKEHLIFALKVAAVILVINQLPPVAGVINRNYFGS